MNVYLLHRLLAEHLRHHPDLSVADSLHLRIDEGILAAHDYQHQLQFWHFSNHVLQYSR